MSQEEKAVDVTEAEHHDAHEIAGITVKNNPVPLSALIVFALIVLTALVSWVSIYGF